MEQDEIQGTGIFAGGQLHVSDSPQAVLQAHSVAADTDVVARSGLAAAQAGGRALNEAVALMDYKERADGLLGLQKAQRDGEQALQLGLTAPYGSEESFYNEDGTVNSAKVEDFKLQLADVYDQVDPRFVSPEARAEWDAEKAEAQEIGTDRLVGQVQRVELANIRQAGGDLLAVMEARGEHNEMVREWLAQHRAGVATTGELRLQRAAVGRRRARSAAAAGDVELETALEALQGGRGGHGAGGAQGKARGKDGKQAVAEADAQYRAGVRSLAERNEAIREARAAHAVAAQAGSFVPGAGVRRSGGRRRSGGGGQGGAAQEHRTGAGVPKVKITLFNN